MSFAISGFLIGGPIYREAIKGQFSIACFYAHRARRIAPALIAVSLAVLAGGALILGASEARDVSSSTLSALLGVSNVRFWSMNDYFSADAQYNPLLMTWSLGIEEQFYLLFPFVIIAALKLKKVRVLAVLLTITSISFTLNLILTKTSPNAAFYLLPPRASELSIGATLAIWQADGNGRLPERLRTPLSMLGMAAIMAVAAVSLSLHQIAGSSLRLSDDVRRIDADAIADKGYPCLVNAGAVAPSSLPPCNQAKAAGSNVAIFGDSHAAALGRAGTTVASERGLGTVVLAKQNCRPLVGVSVYRSKEPDLTGKCSAFLDAATKRLTDDPSLQRVVVGGLWGTPLKEAGPTRYIGTTDATKNLSSRPLLEAGLAALTRQLSQAGKKTIPMQDVPFLSVDPVRATLIEAIPARKFIAELVGGNLEKPGFDSEARQDVDLKAMFDKLAQTPSTSTIEAGASFCSRDGCRFEENGQLLFYDRTHITRHGAKRVFDHAEQDIWK